MKNNKRMNPETRSEGIIEAGLRLAKAHGWKSLTRDGVATEAGVSFAMVNVRFGTMTQLKRAVMREAIRRRELKVVAQGYVSDDPTALKIDDELKSAALQSL